jgi:hypothetical protein
VRHYHALASSASTKRYAVRTIAKLYGVRMAFNHYVVEDD